ncbi:hypothetical protein [Nonomuraea sp. NPDC049141]|uniref:hypothetical protein n=1 Tax=Nonomuraea sp. NPDC049141 TaxID=3155500 RepID=UPI0033C2BBAD
MIGLGGAEFRLPLLISLFGFAALAAVIVNKAMSLIVVVTALPAHAWQLSPSPSWPGTGTSRPTCWPEACSRPGQAPPGRSGCAPRPSTGCSRR